MTTAGGAGRSAGPPGEAAAAALARNDAYLRGFVEALGLCPYARACREGGKLHRRVLLAAGGEPGSAAFDRVVAQAVSATRSIEALPPESVEVALIIFPALEPALSQGAEGARKFELLCAGVRQAMGSGAGRGAQAGGLAAAPSAFYCVPFHPDLPEDLSDAHRAVGFVRRSPDPTLQLVRATVLQAVRGDQGSTFVDAQSLTAEQLLAVAGAASISDRIAGANLATLRREGPERMRALLAGLRA